MRILIWIIELWINPNNHRIHILALLFVSQKLIISTWILIFNWVVCLIINDLCLIHDWRPKLCNLLLLIHLLLGHHLWMLLLSVVQCWIYYCYHWSLSLLRLVNHLALIILVLLIWIHILVPLRNLSRLVNERLLVGNRHLYLRLRIL